MRPGRLLSPSSCLRAVWPSALLARLWLLAPIPLAGVLAWHVQLLHASRLSGQSALRRHLQVVIQGPGLSWEKALRLGRMLLGLSRISGRVEELARWKAPEWGKSLASEVAFVDAQNLAVFCQLPVLYLDHATYWSADLCHGPGPPRYVVANGGQCAMEVVAWRYHADEVADRGSAP